MCGRAYAPGEFKVLVSSDGGNFEEASAWRSASRNEVAYTEMVMFDTPRAVKAVTVVMKAPLSWSYFGLNDVRLLSSADESFMIISGATSASGEQCVVASGSELLLEGCLDAIAAGDGRDVFKFQGGQLVHVASALCVSVASGVGGHVGLHDCDLTAKALDGRSLWEVTPDSQLRMPRMANYCLNVHGGHATVADCGVAAQDIASGDKFILSSVPELDLGAVARLKSSASLLTAAAARQRKALDQLQGLMPVLPTCKFASMAVNKSQLQKSMSLHYVGESSVKADLMLGDAATAAVSRVYDALKVDVDGSAQLIRESANTLKTVDTQFAKFA